MIQRVHGYCALCRSRCGCVSVVEDGRLVAVEPDPTHPTGQALCAKGRAAPQLVHHPERLLHPLRRTRPKGDLDPGWERVTWDVALDEIAGRLRHVASTDGPEAVAFAVTTPSGTAISDAMPWFDRLVNAFGSPNVCNGTEVCNWHKDHAARYTFGVGIAAPDFPRTGCVLYWGHNPSTSWLTHATGAAAAHARGARLIVVDPRRAGLAAKADLWLRVRPGTDGALALGIAGVMIDEGWFDLDFVRDWSNGPFLVRADTGRFLVGRDLGEGEGAECPVAWDAVANRPVVREPATGRYRSPSRDTPRAVAATVAISGVFRIATTGAEVECRPAFQLYSDLCRRYSPERVEAITWVPAAQVRQAARMLWESRPVSYHYWTGVGQTTNATQTDRAISLLYALTGSFDAPGGNVIFPKVPANDIAGAELMPPAQREKALGLAARPLGPPRSGWITSDDLYRAILEGRPYHVRTLVDFGANLVVSHAGAPRARQALAALDFFVCADLFMTPTAALADLVLPVTTCWENENLRIGFEISAEAESLVQLRPRAVEPRGQARSDTAIIFELAQRLGLGAHFWDGDVESAWRHQLAASGVTLEALRRAPGGVRVPLEVHYRKYARVGAPSGAPGFSTPSRKVEVYSEVFLRHDQSPLPEYVEPLVSPVTRPDLAGRYPLVLTCAKLPQFCHSQFRNLPGLRRLVRDPGLEHPATAAARSIADGDWLVIETPEGRVHARARFNDSLDPRVVCGQHGWWQGCATTGAPAYDVYDATGANYNLLISDRVADPISGSVPNRAYLCEVRRVGGEPP